jgi:hypothetical protein
MHQHRGGVPVDSVEDDTKKMRREIALEDYRAWLRELEKQDRWYAQTVWALVAALGAALLPLKKRPDSRRAYLCRMRCLGDRLRLRAYERDVPNVSHRLTPNCIAGSGSNAQGTCHAGVFGP